MFDFIDEWGLDSNMVMFALAASALFWVLIWVVVPAIGITTWKQFPWYLRLISSVLIVPLTYIILNNILNR
jgi:hypothetical protein